MIEKQESVRIDIIMTGYLFRNRCTRIQENVLAVNGIERCQYDIYDIKDNQIHDYVIVRSDLHMCFFRNIKDEEGYI